MVIAASVRFFLLSGVDYHGHVTEWGVHWNFFATIAILNVLSVFVRKSDHCMLAGLSIILAQELISELCDLKSFMLYAPRTDWISANKEGVLSVSGYFAMQLIGNAIGGDITRILLYQDPKTLLK